MGSKMCFDFVWQPLVIGINEEDVVTGSRLECGVSGGGAI
jgi:hypothetical protein